MILGRRLSFRKDLQRLSEFIDLKTQLILLTGTLPPSYEKEFLKTLYLEHSDVHQYRFPTMRENIRYSVLKDMSKTNVLEGIRAKHQQYPDDSLIVYTRTRDQARELAILLQWPVYYSDSSSKVTVLSKFLDNSNRSARLIGTSSIGLGLDKSNIRAIIHVDLPYRLSEYAQESGRTGRDGKPAEALIFLPSNASNSLGRQLSKQETLENKWVQQYCSNICHRWLLGKYLDNIQISCDSDNKPLTSCNYCIPNIDGTLSPYVFSNSPDIFTSESIGTEENDEELDLSSSEEEDNDYQSGTLTLSP